MKTALNRFLLLISILLFVLYVSQCSAQSNDWGVLVNNKEWYYEGGRIFRGTKEQCERKCAELNYHRTGGYITVPGGDYWPTQKMMDDLGNALEEERKKVEKNVYTPAKIISGINDNAMPGNYSVAAIGQIARQNAESNNEYVMSIVGGDPRFNKNNEGFKGTPQQGQKPRPISEVLHDETPCSCSKLMSAKEYEQLADEYLLSPYLFREKYTSLCKQHSCDGTDDDYQIFAKKLKSVVEERLEEMDEEMDR